MTLDEFQKRLETASTEAIADLLAVKHKYKDAISAALREAKDLPGPVTDALLKVQERRIEREAGK
jgi:hypothetical protein